MKTGFDVIDNVYKIVNVSGVTSIINGRIYREKKPPQSELQDIELFALSTSNNEDVQPATVIINMYCKNLTGGIIDTNKLRQITNAVITALEAHTHTSGNYFEVDLRSTLTMIDSDNTSMGYTSLRVNCMIQQKTL